MDTNPSEGFFDSNLGPISTDWVTQDYAVNGIVPQNINVQFSDQTVFNTYDLTDEQNYSGASNFSSTLTLAGIELVDSNGNLASGWTVTSASGTRYNAIQGILVPEPGSMALCIGLASVGAGLYGRRRRK